jgi:hypothetical protein
MSGMTMKEFANKTATRQGSQTQAVCGLLTQATTTRRHYRMALNHSGENSDGK